MAAVADIAGLGYSESAVERWQNGSHSLRRDYVAEEVPISLVYNGIPHAVMLATPADLHAFALGFSLSEEVIEHPGELEALETRTADNGIEVRMRIPGERFRDLLNRGRNLAGRTGCGLCGAQDLEQAVRKPRAVGDGVTVAPHTIHRVIGELQGLQTLNDLTGSVHAAAWAEPGRGLVFLREDVGRHNALDKLIGTLAMQGQSADRGFVVITSRASYEMVQKATTVGITLMAAISAPTGLAIRLARESGQTLIGFARSGSHVVYAHPWRLTG